MKYVHQISISISFLLLLLIDTTCYARHIDCSEECLLNQPTEQFILNDYQKKQRKYVFAPKCRGVSAKRSGLMTNDQILPESSRDETNYLLDNGNLDLGTLERLQQQSDISGKEDSWFGNDVDDVDPTNRLRLQKIEEIRDLLRKFQ